MKITEFLKKYSLIDDSFINDFYTFYDEGKNEHDFVINLELIAKWLNVRKDHLKTLLISNFVEDTDYIIFKNETKLKGTGKNNVKHVLLTYDCSKLLCMISKSDKSSLIRNYYIELEKLIIKYKDEIVESLNKRLKINNSNKKIIDNNKKEALIYILKVDDDDESYKIGNSDDIKNRMKQYNVGRINELPIVFVYKTNNADDIETCIKQNLKSYQLKYDTEIFKIDLAFIKDTINYCNKKNAILIKKNNKLFNSKDDKKWLIIIDRENVDIDNIFKKIKSISSKKSSKTNSVKITKKSSKTNSVKITKKTSKTNSVKIKKKLSKTSINKISKKSVKIK